MGDRCPLGPLQLHCWEDDVCIFCNEIRYTPAPDDFDGTEDLNDARISKPYLFEEE